MSHSRDCMLTIVRGKKFCIAMQKSRIISSTASVRKTFPQHGKFLFALSYFHNSFTPLKETWFLYFFEGIWLGFSNNGLKICRSNFNMILWLFLKARLSKPVLFGSHGIVGIYRRNPHISDINQKKASLYITIVELNEYWSRHDYRILLSRFFMAIVASIKYLPSPLVIDKKFFFS